MSQERTGFDPFKDPKSIQNIPVERTTPVEPATVPVQDHKENHSKLPTNFSGFWSMFKDYQTKTLHDPNLSNYIQNPEEMSPSEPATPETPVPTLKEMMKNWWRKFKENNEAARQARRQAILEDVYGENEAPVPQEKTPNYLNDDDELIDTR